LPPKESTVYAFLAVLLAATFAGKDGVPIAYRIAPRADTAPDRGSLVILPGYTESHLLYEEPIADFTAQGYTVFIMDHRGMGLSGRLAVNPQVVHIGVFEDYVDDAAQFVTTIVKPQSPGKVYLFGHSTGGMIGASLLGRTPDAFAAAVLSAPLMSLDTGWLPRGLARAIVSATCALGFADSYAAGFGDFDMAKHTFEHATTTRSEARFDAQKAVLVANPAIVQGGPSYQWLREALGVTDDLAALAPKVKTPVLLFQAGADSFVSPEGQDAFCAAAPMCRKVLIPGGRHEMFREVDEIRGRFMQETLGFLASH